jgi:hypothetical protein
MLMMVFECNQVEEIKLEFEGPLRLEHLLKLVEELALWNKVEIGAITIRFIEEPEKEDVK